MGVGVGFGDGGELGEAMTYAFVDRSKAILGMRAARFAGWV